MKEQLDTAKVLEQKNLAAQAEYIQIYEQYHDIINLHSSNSLNIQRDASFEKFKNLGFPTPQLENYKYCDLRKTLSVNYGLNINRKKFNVNPYEVFNCDVPGIASHLYFVVNDAFFSTQKDHDKLPEGVIISSLREAANEHPEIVEKYIGKLANKQNDGLIAFNGAFAQDGFFIYVPKNVVIEHPVQVVNIMRSNADLMAISRNLIVLEEGAKAQVLVCDHTMDDVRFFANRVTEVHIGENAFYEHYKVENVSEKSTNVSTLLINQASSSNVLTNIITLNNGLTRNNVEIALNGENCETLLCGIALTDKEQIIDNHTSILHNKPHCHSTELFKYILDDESKGIFTGRLYVAKDAQKTQAYQTNNNVLLSNRAKARTKPQLEIFADDVKCSHGATIGQLDEKAMFYMRQRCIPEKEARLLLMYAFTSAVINNIRINALKDRIQKLVEKRLRRELGRCDKSCSFCG